MADAEVDEAERGEVDEGEAEASGSGAGAGTGIASGLPLAKLHTVASLRPERKCLNLDVKARIGTVRCRRPLRS